MKIIKRISVNKCEKCYCCNCDARWNYKGNELTEWEIV